MKTLLRVPWPMALFHAVAAVVLIDVFMIRAAGDLPFVAGLGLWWVAVKLRSLTARYTFVAAGALLAIMFASFLAFGPDARTERIAVWLYLFFAFGVVQMWFEEKQ